ncbi:hypothetical protein IRJ41_018641, partial [Triplophysa rosa]
LSGQDVKKTVFCLWLLTMTRSFGVPRENRSACTLAVVAGQIPSGRPTPSCTAVKRREVGRTLPPLASSPRRPLRRLSSRLTIRPPFASVNIQRCRPIEPANPPPEHASAYPRQRRVLSTASWRQRQGSALRRYRRPRTAPRNFDFEKYRKGHNQHSLLSKLKCLMVSLWVRAPVTLLTEIESSAGRQSIRRIN